MYKAIYRNPYHNGKAVSCWLIQVSVTGKASWDEHDCIAIPVNNSETELELKVVRLGEVTLVRRLSSIMEEE